MFVGDEVITKKMGVPAIGKVVAIFDKDYYLMLRKQPNHEYSNPENYYRIFFDPPIRQVSLQEMENYYMNADKAKKEYDSIPKENYLDYPESEIELYE